MITLLIILISLTLAIGIGGYFYLRKMHSRIKEIHRQVNYFEQEIEQRFLQLQENSRQNYSDILMEIKNVSNQLEDLKTEKEADDRTEEELYEEAEDLVVDMGKASASFLQRCMRIGYARAALLIDMLEERGVIGPGEGAKPREVVSGRWEDLEEEFIKPDEDPEE